MRPEGSDRVACRVAEAEHPEVREFMSREWPGADRRLFGADLDWTSRPVVVEARAGRELAGVALGEAVAGMARLHDLLVAEPRQGRGLGGRLVELFCVRAAELGAGRCFLRCPTPTAAAALRALGLADVARLPRYTTRRLRRVPARALLQGSLGLPRAAVGEGARVILGPAYGPAGPTGRCVMPVRRRLGFRVPPGRPGADGRPPAAGPGRHRQVVGGQRGPGPGHELQGDPAAADGDVGLVAGRGGGVGHPADEQGGGGRSRRTDRSSGCCRRGAASPAALPGRGPGPRRWSP